MTSGNVGQTVPGRIWIFPGPASHATSRVDDATRSVSLPTIWRAARPPDRHASSNPYPDQYKTGLAERTSGARRPARAGGRAAGGGNLKPAGQPDAGDPERGEDCAESVHRGDHEPGRDDQHLQRGGRPERPAHAPSSYQAAEQEGADGQAAADAAGQAAVGVLKDDGDRDREADDHGLHDQYGPAQLPHLLRLAPGPRSHESSAAVKEWRDGWLADGSAGSSPPPGTSSLRASPAVMTDPVTRTPEPPGRPATPAWSASATAASMASSSRAADCTRSSPKTSAASSAASAGSMDRSEELRVTTIWSSSGSSSASIPETSLSPLAANTPAR